MSTVSLKIGLEMTLMASVVEQPLLSVTVTQKDFVVLAGMS